MHADKIFVLEKGHIIESGRHEELLKEKGLYYAMWRQQIGEKHTKEI
jgi:ATP-binding cassette subfamily B protein